MLPQPKRISRQHTRADTRVDFFNRVRVFARGRNKCINMLSENISHGGIFVCGNQILPAGTRVAMEVETKRRGLMWVEDAEVVWNKPIRRAGIPVPPGMGVKFVQVSPRSRKLIEEEVKKALARRPRPGRVRRLTPATQPPPLPVSQSAREETRDITPSRSRRYLVQLLVAVAVGIVVGAYLVSLIHPRSQGSKEPAKVAKATTLPKVSKRKPKPRPVKKKVLVAKAAPVKKPVQPAPPKVEKPVVKAEAKGPPAVALPEFRKTTDGWQMVLQATAPVQIKHFKLKNPPRLAFDLHQARYTGEQKRLRSPAPFITRLRVGKRPGFVRFVLDFKGKRVPRHKVAKEQGRAIVSFF